MSKYRKLSPLEHVLARPDTYIGSVETETEHSYVPNDDATMTWRPVTFNPGLYKIVDEIIVNAIDQSVIDSSVDKIAIDVDPDEGRITVLNTGRGIPVEKHAEYDDVYVPELIFGHLLTSSNYDDDEERIVGGKNGLGAKLANIYSTTFEVEIGDPTTRKKYLQVFENNMTVARPARITSYSKAKGYVRISFVPDLARFGLRRLDDDDNVAVIRRRAWDASACTAANVKVLFNGEVVPIKTFAKYVDMFVGRDAPRAFMANEDGRWEVAVSSSSADGGFRHVSFVNGIATTKGGTHVTHATNAIVEGLRGLNAKKYADVKPAFVRDHMFVFVRATLVNPSFSSQTKSECTSKVASFGSRFAASEAFLKKVAKLGIMEEALALSKHRETRQMSKTDGVKTSTIRGIPKLEDAVKAGSARDSGRCTLLVVEGDSAKTFAISGLSVLGRDYWGIYPLRGKLLNVRDASPKQITENQEIQQLKQILGLQQGRRYDTDADMATLRYGRVMLLTDADLDGSHIKGLVINLFEVFWPGLVKKGFLSCMTTPIVKARRGQEVLAFYTQREYEAWKKNEETGWSIRYYKGLGTSTAAEAREYFGDVAALTTSYRHVDGDGDEAAIILAFKKDRARDRKTWILEHCERAASVDVGRGPEASISDFVHRELVHFSIADVIRSIPSVCDGLKPSQRKVLYGALKKNLDRDEIKVSQLAGYIAEVTAYHHGDASLQGTIVGMAQNFVGSNNINLLAPVGQFGTRLQGGKDAASARYIFTKLGSRTRAIFDARDDALLAPQDDDGYAIEPVHYVPTLPMVLINGAEGIGTGFSTSIPCYDPADLEANVQRYLRGEAMTSMTPWYRGFAGTVEAVAETTSFGVRGRFEKRGARDLWITELPIGMWTQTYKEWLEDDARRKFPLTKFENHSTETAVLFKLTFPDAAARDAAAQDHKILNLCSALHTGNMYLIDARGKIRHYATPLDILEEYCRVRLDFYTRRRRHLLDAFGADLAEIEERTRFVRAVVDGALVVFGRPLADVRADMTAMNFANCDALLETRVASLTLEKVRELERRGAGRRADIDRLVAATPGSMWLDDLKKM